MLIERYKIRITVTLNNGQRVYKDSDYLNSMPFIEDPDITYSPMPLNKSVSSQTLNWTSYIPSTSPPTFTILQSYSGSTNYWLYEPGRNEITGLPNNPVASYTPIISPPSAPPGPLGPPAPSGRIIQSSGSGILRCYSTSLYKLVITITSADGIEHRKSIPFEYRKPKGGSRKNMKRGKRRSIKRKNK
jgi:hypothetical protein